LASREGCDGQFIIDLFGCISFLAAGTNVTVLASREECDSQFVIDLFGCISFLAAGTGQS
jgi:hypothetical protein